MEHIFYRSGYKYQVTEDYTLDIKLKLSVPVSNEYIRFDTEGFLCIRHGYAWDGPSGLAIDTKNFMRGSLIHDALYQLMREGLLSSEHFRRDADELLYKIVKEDGMSWFRAQYVYHAVRMFGSKYATKTSKSKGVLKAP